MANTQLANLGQPNFGVIDIDGHSIAKALEAYLVRGSRLTGVAIEEISMRVSIEPADPKHITLPELLKCGMKLFDALVWMTAGRPTDPSFSVDPGYTQENITPLHEIARAVFYTYFFLLTQARYPVANSEAPQPTTPAFLRTIMGMAENQSVYIRKICSFEPSKFDGSWIKSVNFANFGQEALSRFGLGVAGYRLFGPFKLYPVRDNATPQARRAYEFARRVAIADATWDIHPTTRNPDVLKKRGNLNKNLGNLILACFTEEQIKEMTTAKVLYTKPVAQPGYQNWQTWTEDDDISGTSYIFAH